MTSLPPAEPAALAGIGFIVLFALWKRGISPYLARRRAGVAAGSA